MFRFPDVLSATQGRHNLKIRNIQSGKTTCIIKAGQKEVIEDIKVIGQLGLLSVT